VHECDCAKDKEDERELESIPFDLVLLAKVNDTKGAAGQHQDRDKPPIPACSALSDAQERQILTQGIDWFHLASSCLAIGVK
jgi:hypothetical protein